MGRRTPRTVAAMAVAAVMTVALTSCSTTPTPRDRPVVLSVETLRSTQPSISHGVGTVVGDDLVLTAGHVVDGDVRELRVGKRLATVLTIDPETDLALISVPLPDYLEPAVLGEVPEAGQAGEVVTTTGIHPIDVDRHITWRLDTVDGATQEPVTYRRDALVFRPPFPRGSSGAPVIDDDRQLVGVVVSTAAGETYAVSSDEVRDLLAQVE